MKVPQKYFTEFDRQQYLNKERNTGITKAYLTDDIYEFEAFCKTLPFIPITECKEIYRALGLRELIKLIAGKEIKNTRLLGFSFAKTKDLAKFVATQYQKDGYIVTFDAQIMNNNFTFIDIKPNIDLLHDFPKVAYHLTGFPFDLENGPFNEAYRWGYEMMNKLHRIDGVKPGFSKTHNNYECMIELLNLYEPKLYKDLLYNSSINETLLSGPYHFVPGMITNIQVSTRNNMRKLYNFILKNQEKLNLEL
jgi:hypothetical protein